MEATNGVAGELGFWNHATGVSVLADVPWDLGQVALQTLSETISFSLNFTNSPASAEL